MSNPLNREVGPIEILWAVVFGIPLIVLFAMPRHRDAGAAFIAAIILCDLRAALVRRRARRRIADQRRESSAGAAETVSLRETAYLPFAPEAAWAVLHPAESAPLLNPDTVKAYRVPGTPDGLGEQQAFIDTRGNTTVIEVVEWVPGQRSVTRQLSPKPPVPGLTTWAVEPYGDGCIVSFQQDLTVSAAQWPEPNDQERWRAGVQEMFRRLGHTLHERRPPNNTVDPGGEV